MSSDALSFQRFCAEYRKAMVRLSSPFGKRARETADEREARMAERLTWNVSFLSQVASNLGGFRRSVVFSRPAMLSADNLELHNTLRAARSRKASKADRMALQVFGEWRNQVTDAEQRDACNVETLLCVVHNALPDPHAESNRRKVLAHVEREYACRVPWPFDSASDIPSWSARAMRREATMPTWLMLGQRPPRWLEREDGTIEDTDA